MQERLFFDDVNDALRDVVQALGGAKRVGPVLWPEKTVDQAGHLLMACLNVERKERLTPEQVFLLLKMARQANFHAAKFWMDAELGYEQGKPVNPQDKQAELQRDFIASVQLSRQLADRLEKLTQAPLKAVG
jgi:hypothetical protein